MLISADNAEPQIVAPIYDEYRRRRYTGVFLDLDASPTEKYTTLLSAIVDGLSRRVENIYIPADFAEFCRSATPVVSSEISGGTLYGYLSRFINEHGKVALAVRRICRTFSMPSSSPEGTSVTLADAKALIEQHGSGVFYSPEMLVNYFTYPKTRTEYGFALFDDARSISEKIRLAKKLQISEIFLNYKETSDIIDEIIL